MEKGRLLIISFLKWINSDPKRVVLIYCFTGTSMGIIAGFELLYVISKIATVLVMFPSNAVAIIHFLRNWFDLFVILYVIRDYYVRYDQKRRIKFAIREAERLEEERLKAIKQ